LYQCLSDRYETKTTTTTTTIIISCFKCKR